MIILKDKAGVNIHYNTDSICRSEQLLYFDIETTGFSRQNNYIYLIGCLYYKEGQLYITQYLAENPSEEALILQEFHKRVAKHSTLINYNGQSFDIPFVAERAKNYDIDFNFDQYKNIDLYKMLKPFSPILKLENLKQKTLEKLIGIQREDPFSGGDLITVYQEYVKTKDHRLYKALIQHNMEDVIYLAKLTSLLGFIDFMNGKFHVNEYKITDYKDHEGTYKKELVIKLHIHSKVPFNISYGNNGIYITGSGKDIALTVSLLEGEMKYFFKNYKDYYYLPAEDKAIHKSISSFVDKKHRTNATPDNCYIKKTSLFMPVFNTSTDDFGELFSTTSKDKSSWAETSVITDENIKLYSKILIKNIL